MVRPGTGRHEEVRKGLARKSKGMIVGTEKRLCTFRALARMKLISEEEEFFSWSLHVT
jgi:hypothetical protein